MNSKYALADCSWILGFSQIMTGPVFRAVAQYELQQIILLMFICEVRI
jgi:hypothetical protein